MFYDNRVEYFGDPTKMDSVDYFVSDKEIPITREDLKEMQHNGVITEVYRHYDEETGFSRIRLINSSATK